MIQGHHFIVIIDTVLHASFPNLNALLLRLCFFRTKINAWEYTEVYVKL